MIKRNVRKSTKALVTYKKNKEVKEMLKKISKLERKKNIGKICKKFTFVYLAYILTLTWHFRRLSVFSR